jgi:hypothetical protein
MPMIDIYAVAGTFADPKQLAIDAATTVKTIPRPHALPPQLRARRDPCCRKSHSRIYGSVKRVGLLAARARRDEGPLVLSEGGEVRGGHQSR